MPDKIGVGIIGLGAAGKNHLQALNACEKARVLSAADISESARNNAAEHVKGPDYIADYRRILDRKDIDLVLIATPHNTHLPLTLDAFNAGKHVFCEKPLAMNTAECDRMLSASKKSGKRLFVFQNQRSNPNFNWLKKTLSTVDFGKPAAAVIQYLGCELERMKDPDNWKCSYEQAGGGVLLDGGVHVIDMSNWYMGVPVSVIANIHRPDDWLENKAETSGNLIVTYANGSVVQIFASFETLLPGSFTEGTLRIMAELFFQNGTASAIYEYLGPKGMSSWAKYICGSDEEHIFKATDADRINYHENVLKSLMNGSKPIVTPEEARMAIAVVDAAYKSARTGRSVPVSPLPE